MVVKLLLHLIDRLDQVPLVAAGEGHARDGKLNGNQRLMYCGRLLSIHGRECELVCRKPQALGAVAVSAADGPIKKPRLGGGALHKVSQLSDCYFAGAVADVSVEDFLLFLLWLFL